MQIILIEPVQKLGIVGDEVVVKDGYARNFLFPTQKALRATEANRKRFAHMRVELEQRNLRAREAARKIASELDGQVFQIERQASDSGRLYGSVSTRDIAMQIEKSAIELSRSCVVLDQPIKSLGNHLVELRLHPEVICKVLVSVVSPGGVADGLDQLGANFLLASEYSYGGLSEADRERFLEPVSVLRPRRTPLVIPDGPAPGEAYAQALGTVPPKPVHFAVATRRAPDPGDVSPKATSPISTIDEFRETRVRGYLQEALPDRKPRSRALGLPLDDLATLQKDAQNARASLLFFLDQPSDSGRRNSAERAARLLIGFLGSSVEELAKQAASELDEVLNRASKAPSADTPFTSFVDMCEWVRVRALVRVRTEWSDLGGGGQCHVFLSDRYAPRRSRPRSDFRMTPIKEGARIEVFIEPSVDAEAVPLASESWGSAQTKFEKTFKISDVQNSEPPYPIVTVYLNGNLLCEHKAFRRVHAPTGLGIS